MIKIPKKIFDKIVEQGLAAMPVEACGILAGTGNSVELAYPMENADNSSEHFTLVPEEQFAVIKDIRAKGLKMLSVYHTHPETPARPSEEDIKLALTPNIIYTILSLMDKTKPEIKGFLIEAGKVEEGLVEITE